MSIISEVMQKLDDFTALTMQAAGMPPVAVGSSGSMLATGAASYLSQMFSTAQAALTSEIGLADADTRLRTAAMNAAVQREKIAADMQKATMAAGIEEQKLGLEGQKIELQQDALDFYKQSYEQAHDIESLAQSLAAGSYVEMSSVTDSSSSPDASALVASWKKPGDTFKN